MNYVLHRGLLALVGIFVASSASAALKAADLIDRAAVIEYASYTKDVANLTTLSATLADVAGSLRR